MCVAIRVLMIIGELCRLELPVDVRVEWDANVKVGCRSRSSHLSNCRASKLVPTITACLARGSAFEHRCWQNWPELVALSLLPEVSAASCCFGRLAEPSLERLCFEWQL